MPAVDATVVAMAHPDAAEPGAGPSREQAGEARGTVMDSRSAPDGASRGESGTMTKRSDRTRTVLIAALGGEGGGVLSSWLVDAAAADGRRVQATSVPGVAQRTGATTYYLEIGPRGSGAEPGAASDAHLPTDPAASRPAGDDGGRAADVRTGSTIEPSTRDDPSGRANPPGRHADTGAGSAEPVMALLPTPGNVDLLVASELLEAGRAAQAGMITPDRTTVIASTHRTFAITEKSAMGDGRFEDERIRHAVRELSHRHVLTDLGKVAEQAGTVLSSVLLGAVAGSGALPIPLERLRAAVERAGIAVEANLRGFEAGCRLFDETNAEASPSGRAAEPGGAVPGTAGAAAAHPPRTPADMASGETPTGTQSPLRTPPDSASGATPTGTPDSLGARLNALPEPVREFARLGLDRTVEYQDTRYGALYLDRVERLLARAESAGAAPGDACGVAREVARQLALWMCFEDIVRVADLKTRRSRIERVRAEVRAKPGQPVVITEFLKPGVDEWCSLLPALIARPILRAANRGGWRRRLNVGLHVRTSSVTGFLLLWTLARLKRLRRGMHRFVEEQARIETWLERVGDASATSAALALEAARCASLVKGYGDTHDRGVRNFERTMACLDACARARDPAASLRMLREAALADPDGDRLDAAVAALHADAAPVGSG